MPTDRCSTYKEPSMSDKLKDAKMDAEEKEVHVIYIKTKLMRAELAYERAMEHLKELQERYDWSVEMSKHLQTAIGIDKDAT